MKSLVLSVPLEQPLALLSLMPDVFGVILFVLILPPIAWLFVRLWPSTAEEALSRAQYIRGRSYDNVAAALELIALEQRRVLSGFSSYLDAVRQGLEVDSLRVSVKTLIREIEEFLTEVRVHHPGYGIDEVNSALAQQRLIMWLEEQFGELCEDLNRLPGDTATSQLRSVFVEGIDAVVLVIVDGLTSPDPESWATIRQLTRDRSELLRQIRSNYLSSEPPPGEAVQVTILKITNTTGEIFFLFARLTQEMTTSQATAGTSPLSPL